MRTIIRWSIGASVLAACLFALPGGLGIRVAAAQTTLRMTWYSDGNEGEVMADLLRRFEDKNRDIRVALDQVPFKAINENLPVQLASGQGPDIARVGDLGGLARYMLDLRPYLKNAAYWEANYGPFLQWMRVPGDTSSIPGFMTQLTVTGPFVNKTLFEQAGVAMPGPKATWEDWAKATKEVAAKVKAPFPIAFDRSGHRFFGCLRSAVRFHQAGHHHRCFRGGRILEKAFGLGHLSAPQVIAERASQGGQVVAEGEEEPSPLEHDGHRYDGETEQKPHDPARSEIRHQPFGVFNQIPIHRVTVFGPDACDARLFVGRAPAARGMGS